METVTLHVGYAGLEVPVPAYLLTWALTAVPNDPLGAKLNSMDSPVAQGKIKFGAVVPRVTEDASQSFK